MAENTWQIAASANDRGWYEGTAAIGSANAVNIFVGYYNAGANGYYRFIGVDIPQGATILSAKITLTANDNQSGTTVNGILSAIDADNPSAPTTYAALETATRTTASVAWDDIAAWTTDTAYDSPDITTIIQEIVDRPGWSSGNALIVYLEDNSSSAVEGAYRQAYTYDSSPAKAAKLYVSWVTPETISDSVSLSESVDLVEVVDRIYKTDTDTVSLSESIKVDKSLVLTDTIYSRDSAVPVAGSYAEVLSHPHTSKLYLAVKVPRIVWKGRVLRNRGYNQSGDIEADLQININTALPYGNEEGFDVTNFMPDLTVWVGTTDGGKEHGKCRIRSFSGNNLVVSADMTCSWKVGDYISITDLHELWPMPHVVIESGNNVTVYKDHDLSAGSYKDEYPVVIMGCSPCAFLDEGSVDVEFYSADSYLVQPNSDEVYWDEANGITAYSWWFEGADVTTSSEPNPTATYSQPGQYVVSLELTGENGKTFKSFRNVFIFERTGANAPITDFAIESLSGSLQSRGWEAVISVFGDTFNPDNLPDKAEVVLFSEEWFGGEARTLKVGHAGVHKRDNIKMVGYASDTSLTYESGKIRSAKMSIQGLQKYLQGKTNFPVYVTQIEEYAPSWSRFDDGLTVRKALYHLVRWHWTLLRFADFLIPDDHNNYFPGQSWAEGSLASQLDSFCPDIQAQWAVDKTGALVVFSWPNYLPVSGDGAGWRTRLYNDVSFTEADFSSLEVEHRIRDQVARVRVEGVFATKTNYWTSVDMAPGDIRNTAGGTKTVKNQVLGTGGFVGSQGEELARMVYAEESRRYERILLKMCGNYSFLDIVPGANYFKLTAKPATLRGLSWNAKPFWVEKVSLSFEHECGDIGVSIQAIPETRPDPSLAIYSQFDEIGEDLTRMPGTGEFGMADLLQEIDRKGNVLVPALMGDGGAQTNGAETGTSLVRLFGDLNQAVVAENRILQDIVNRPVYVEVTKDDSGKAQFRITHARIANDTLANEEFDRAFTTRYACYSQAGAISPTLAPVPILQLGPRMPQLKVVRFMGRLGVGGLGATVSLYLNEGALSTINIMGGEGPSWAEAEVNRNLVTGDYLGIKIDAASGCQNLGVWAECLVYGI